MSEDGWDDWGNENIESTPAANNNRQNDNRQTDSRRNNRDNRHDDESWNERRRGPGRDRDNERGGENSESLKVTYEYQYDDNLNYDQRVNQGIDFEKYDEIPVKCTVPDAVTEELGEIEPIAQFSEILDLNPTILQNIQRCKWNKPTPIQKYCIPHIANKLDVMACAQTGSGKTAAFAIPICNILLQTGYENQPCSQIRPQVLVVAPTRELVMQIDNEFKKILNGTGLHSEFVIGGHATRSQRARIESKGCNILCATPGRLRDWVNKAIICLEDIQFVILDEADRMLDHGFKQDLYWFTEKMNDKEERQTLMFSATFENEVQSLAKEFLKNNYAFITVGVVGAAAATVTQHVLSCTGPEKMAKLIEIVSEARENDQKTLIFVETRRFADYLGTKFCENDIPATTIHGDRTQQQREQALNSFKSGQHPFLIATSVAARGLDIPGVEHVINFDFPTEMSEYIHRIGRTGRCGNKGTATSFYDQGKNSNIAKQLVDILSSSKMEVPDFLQQAVGINTPSQSFTTAGSTAPLNSTNQHVESDEDDW